MNFKTAAATIIGESHFSSKKNNQDAYLLTELKDIKIGIISDGCGSCNLSEIGANLIPKLMTKHILLSGIKDCKKFHEIHTILDECSYNVLKDLSKIASILDNNDFNRIIHDYFLCTMIGFVSLPELTTIFYIGDGIYYINGEKHIIGPFVYNAPPFLVYKLLPKELINEFIMKECYLEFQDIKTDDINSIIIGSDGVNSFIKEQIEGLCENTTYFYNLREELIKTHHKNLKDDYTMVIMKDNSHDLLYDTAETVS